MKKIRLLTVFAITVLFSGCVTTSEIKDEPEIETVQKEIESEKKEIQVVSISETFYKTLMDTDFILQSSPKRTSVGKKFDGAYVLRVQDDNGNARKAFPITVSYPSSRINDVITYATENLVSDDEGIVSFTAPVPEFPCNDKVTFYATPDPSDQKSAQIALDFSVQSAYEVRSTMVYKSGVLFVWDLNEKGFPTSNSTAILTEFRNRGIYAGNAPVSDSSYISKSINELYKANKKMLDGSGTAYLIAGTVEFVKPVYAEDGLQICELRAPLSCVDMKTGKVLYETTVTCTASGKTYWYAVQNCKDELAKKFVDAVIYGM